MVDDEEVLSQGRSRMGGEVEKEVSLSGNGGIHHLVIDQVEGTESGYTCMHINIHV